MGPQPPAAGSLRPGPVQRWAEQWAGPRSSGRSGPSTQACAEGSAQLQAPLTAQRWLNLGGGGCSVLVDGHGPNRLRRGEGLPPRAGRAPSLPHCFSLAAPGEVQLPSSPGVQSPLGAAEGPGPQGHPRVLVPISWPLVTCGGVSALAGAAQTFHREDSSALDGSGLLNYGSPQVGGTPAPLHWHELWPTGPAGGGDRPAKGWAAWCLCPEGLSPSPCQCFLICEQRGSGADPRPLGSHRGRPGTLVM